MSKANGISVMRRFFHHRRRIPPFYIRQESRPSFGTRSPRPKLIDAPEVREARALQKQAEALTALPRLKSDGPTLLEEVREVSKFKRDTGVAVPNLTAGTVPPVTPKQTRAALATDQDLRWRIFQRDDYRCLACGTKTDLTVDHIVPVIHGGTNVESNVQTLCRPCNSEKGTTTVSYMPPAAETRAAVASKKRSDALCELDEIFAQGEESINCEAGFADKMVEAQCRAIHAPSPSERKQAELWIAEVIADAKVADLPIPGDTPEFWARISRMRTELQAARDKAQQRISNTYESETELTPDEKKAEEGSRVRSQEIYQRGVESWEAQQPPDTREPIYDSRGRIIGYR
jgi:hypothetical protein